MSEGKDFYDMLQAMQDHLRASSSRGNIRDGGS